MLIWEEGESRRLIGPKDWILSIVKGLDNERPHLNRFAPLSTLDKKKAVASPAGRRCTQWTRRRPKQNTIFCSFNLLIKIVEVGAESENQCNDWTKNLPSPIRTGPGQNILLEESR